MSDALNNPRTGKRHYVLGWLISAVIVTVLVAVILFVSLLIACAVSFFTGPYS